jgi:membrane dipeptidase
MADAWKDDLIAEPETMRFHEQSFVFDALSLYYVIEEPYAERLLIGGVDATNVTFAVEEEWDDVQRYVEHSLESIERSPVMRLVTTHDELLAAKEGGKLAIVMGTQGASMLGRDPILEEMPDGAGLNARFDRLEWLCESGLRSLGLSYTAANVFADGCGETRDAGLSFLGQDLVACVNELNLMLDLSHTGHRSRAEAAALARAPVCTHSNAYALVANDRNTKDETVKAIAAKGGMMGIVAFPGFIADHDPTVAGMVDHMDHFIGLVGEDRVGIGTDFTEAYQDKKVVLPESRRWRTRRPDMFGSVDDFLVLKYPLPTIRLLPNLTQAMFDRGYSKERVAAILGGNWLRTFKAFVG